MFIASWLVYNPALKFHFRFCFLGPLLLAIGIEQVPQERDSEREISMPEVHWWVLLGITPVREWRKHEWTERGVELWSRCSRSFSRSLGSSEAQAALQRCPELRQGGWAFVLSPFWVWVAPREGGMALDKASTFSQGEYPWGNSGPWLLPVAC